MARFSDPEEFVLNNTRLMIPPLVPEIMLRLASELDPIWKLTEEELQEKGVPPPYWAFAWAGGQALARYILDNPEIVKGKRVLDFASGSGIVAIAAMKAGAMSARAVDIDAFACKAAELNGVENDVDVWVRMEDVVGRPNDGWDVILAGDIYYEKPLADRVEAWMRDLAADGATVLIGDPGRAYLPKDTMEKLATYEVETTRELEDMEIRRSCVWRFKAV